jgi:hypothetical protein
MQPCRKTSLIAGLFAVAAMSACGGSQERKEAKAPPAADEPAAAAEATPESEPEPAQPGSSGAVAVGDDPCPEVLDHLFGLMADAMVAQVGPDEADTIIEELEAQRPEFLAVCREDVANDPEAAQPAIDCVLASTSLEELEQCPDL